MCCDLAQDALYLCIKGPLAYVNADSRQNVCFFDDNVFDVKGLDLLMISPASGCCIHSSAYIENLPRR